MVILRALILMAPNRLQESEVVSLYLGRDIPTGAFDYSD